MRVEAKGKGDAAVLTCSTKQLVHAMLITGWQVDLLMSQNGTGCLSHCAGNVCLLVNYTLLNVSKILSIVNFYMFIKSCITYNQTLSCDYGPQSTPPAL